MTAEHTPTPARRRGSAFVVSVATTVVGSCVIVGALFSSGASAVASMAADSWAPVSYDGPVENLNDLDIDIAGGNLTVVYGDVQRAQLEAGARGRGGWTFDRRGDTLRVASPTAALVNGGSDATLTLPRELEGSGIDADIEVGGGALTLRGGFGRVAVEVAGGSLRMDGAAVDADLSVSGGTASVELADAETSRFEVAGGELTARLSGVTPSRTDVEVTAGSADITLPDDEYAVRVDDGLGSVDNRLRTNASAVAKVDVQATMGSVTLRS